MRAIKPIANTYPRLFRNHLALTRPCELLDSDGKEPRLSRQEDPLLPVVIRDENPLAMQLQWEALEALRIEMSEDIELEQSLELDPSSGVSMSAEFLLELFQD